MGTAAYRELGADGEPYPEPLGDGELVLLWSRMHCSRSVPVKPVHLELDDVPPAELLSLVLLPGVEVSVLEGLPPEELLPDALPPEELSPLELPPVAPLPDAPLAPALLPPALPPPALPPPPAPPPPCAHDALARPSITAVTAALISFNFITGIPLCWGWETLRRGPRKKNASGFPSSAEFLHQAFSAR